MYSKIISWSKKTSIDSFVLVLNWVRTYIIFKQTILILRTRHLIVETFELIQAFWSHVSIEKYSNILSHLLRLSSIASHFNKWQNDEIQHRVSIHAIDDKSLFEIQKMTRNFQIDNCVILKHIDKIKNIEDEEVRSSYDEINNMINVYVTAVFVFYMNFDVLL